MSDEIHKSTQVFAGCLPLLGLGVGVKQRRKFGDCVRNLRDEIDCDPFGFELRLDYWEIRKVYIHDDFLSLAMTAMPLAPS